MLSTLKSLLHSFLITIIICTLSLFEVSESIRLHQAMATTQQEAMQTTGKDPFKDSGKTLTGEESDAKTLETGGNWNIGLDQLIAFFFAIFGSLVAIGALKSCFGSVRKGIPGAACGWSTGLAATGALTFLTAEVWNYVAARKGTVGKIAYSEDALEKYGYFCQLYNQLDDDDKPISQWNTELKKAIPELDTEKFEKEYPVYCNQLGALTYQADSLQKIADSLKTKWILNLAAGAAYLAASAVEIWGITKNQKDHANVLTKLLNAMAECEKAAGIAATTPSHNYKFLCLHPMARCVIGLGKFDKFYSSMVGKEEARKWTPSSSNSLFCSKAFIEHSVADSASWRFSCFTALTGCETIGKIDPPSALQGEAATALCFKGLLPFSVANTKKKAQVGCSLGDGFVNAMTAQALRAQEKELSSSLSKMDIKGFSFTESLTADLGTLSNMKDTANVATAIQKIEQIQEIQKKLEALPSGSRSKVAIDKAVAAAEAGYKTGYKSVDACEIACNDKPIRPPISLNFNEATEKFVFDQDAFEKELSTEIKYLRASVNFFERVLGISTVIANEVKCDKDDPKNDPNCSQKKGGTFEGLSFFGGLLGVLGVGGVALFAGVKGLGYFSKWFYKTGPVRSIWNGSLGGVAILNAMNTMAAEKKLREDLKKVNEIVGDYRALTTIDVAVSASESTNYQQNVNAKFETGAEQNYADMEVPKTPCLNGGNGRGGCRGVGQSLKASFKSLGDLGQTGLSNDIAKLAESLNGTKNISGALGPANNLANAVGKIKSLRKRLMKKVNANRKKMGLKPVDIEKRERSLANGMMKMIKSMKNPEIQAKLNGETLASAKPAIDENEKDLIEKLKARKKGGAEETKKEEDFMSGLKFDFKAKKENNIADYDMEDNNDGDKLDALDIQMDDISKQSGADIFKVISTRYFKSAYPVLLEEIE